MASPDQTATTVAAAKTVEKEIETVDGVTDGANITNPEVMGVDEKDETSRPDSESKEQGANEKKEKVLIGMVCDKKDLYQKIDAHNHSTWTAELPADLEEAAENEETEKYALLVRNKKSYDSRKKLDIDSIVIQSPLLKNVLHEILKDYPGVTTNLTRLIFTAPFRPFFHRWEQLTAALTGDYDEDTKTHLKLLYDVLYAELKDVIIATKDYVKNKVVTYDHVWTIFQPGCTVFTSRYGKPVVVRLTDGEFIDHAKYGPCFRLKCDKVDWDGSKFGYDNTPYFIFPFVGTMAITDLNCVPLAYHQDADAIAARLIARGRLFEKLAGHHYRAYRGLAIEKTNFGPSKITVDCRIVIDAAAHSRANPNDQLYLKSFNHTMRAATAVQVTYDSRNNNDDDWLSNCSGSGSVSWEEVDDFTENQNRRAPLTDEQLLLCTCMVRGYALKTKKWLEFFIDSVGEITFNENAFDSLVLPEGHKSLILAFAQSQVKNKETFDDVISGKGRGIIMLLSGGPGIGKTLTAESVAETMRVPLYMMSAGDLGTNSTEVEWKLTDVLEMVAKWNAVLLLDECDVFLEARSTHDLDRNRIVSIFLRTLEYYEGILFLTTNRVHNMDEAFHSRIHFSLEYPPLDEAARGAVWRGFLDRQAQSTAAAATATGHEVREEEIARLAKLNVNGRVIKNLLKTSNLLACSRGQKLGFAHLATVLQVEGYKIPE
ncbi:P-loop containing nucleoside triphosphate hydrolase protein [Biscogniauxia marginata]|nr:P-loop containing nucleoside triphosphate hydrolase protein [Biscogniauxia marginata]